MKKVNLYFYRRKNALGEPRMIEDHLSGIMLSTNLILWAGVPGDRHQVIYECCPEPYVDITFKIHIRDAISLQQFLL